MYFFLETAENLLKQALLNIIKAFKCAYPNSRWITTGAAILSARAGSCGWESEVTHLDIISIQGEAFYEIS